MILRELANDETDEWSELLPLVEYLLDNTPGPHGYTPRDLERSWSLGLDLEKDLITCRSVSCCLVITYL